MKNVFSLVVIVLMITLSVKVNAQVKFGVKAGLNMSNIAQNYKESDYEDATKMRMAYQFGATVEYGLSDALCLQSGLLLSSKGYKYDLEDGLEEGKSVDGYAKVIYNYLELPVNVAYKINSFQVYAGPYFGFCIGGKNKWDYTYKYDGDEESDEGDYKLKPFFGEVGEGDLDEDEDAVNALDMGINLGVGYQTGPILINAGYSLGLGNIAPKYEGDSDRSDWKTSNRVLSLSVSYFFGE